VPGIALREPACNPHRPGQHLECGVVGVRENRMQRLGGLLVVLRLGLQLRHRQIASHSRRLRR
jgi:hypothetical protein